MKDSLLPILIGALFLALSWTGSQLSITAHEGLHLSFSSAWADDDDDGDSDSGSSSSSSSGGSSNGSSGTSSGSGGDSTYHLKQKAEKVHRSPSRRPAFSKSSLQSLVNLRHIYLTRRDTWALFSFSVDSNTSDEAVRAMTKELERQGFRAALDGTAQSIILKQFN